MVHTPHCMGWGGNRRGGGSDPDPRVLLGISCDYHDSAAALVVDGEIAAAAEEERFTRRKHDDSLPAAAIASCLAVSGLEAGDVDVVVLYERPLTVISRFMATRRREGPRGMPAFVRDGPTLVKRNLMVAYRIDRELRRLGARTSPEFRYSEHHRSHAAAAFFPSPFERAAILTVDGIGEWTTASVAVGHGAGIEVLDELRYPDSLGLLYSLVTSWCGFAPNDGEYKVMGLAPYGQPTFRDALDELVHLREDGSLEVEAERIGWYRPSGRSRRRLESLLGGPPRPRDDEVGQREADLAASMQQLTEDVMLRLARHAHDRTGAAALCMAGGVALNCVANGRILREGPFDELWVQPAAGDSGSAVGAALHHWHEVVGKPRRIVRPDAMRGAFLGPSVHTDEVDSWMEQSDLQGEREADPDELCDRVAAELEGGAVVGWFGGRMELGPRALGHRSILADPRSETVRARLNRRVKGREDFRPFAPAVLAEHAAEWFELEGESPYMLVVAPVRDEHLHDVATEPATIAERADVPRSDLPACTHVDGSARIQTVDAERNPDLHRLLSAFHRRTGCPVLVNTSFNIAGEPIVATPDDALRTARRAGLDLLVVEDRMIRPAADRDAADPAGTSAAGVPATEVVPAGHFQT